MNALWWALGVAVLMFAARALVDAIRRRDEAAAPEATPDREAPEPSSENVPIPEMRLTTRMRLVVVVGVNERDSSTPLPVAVLEAIRMGVP